MKMIHSYILYPYMKTRLRRAIEMKVFLYIYLIFGDQETLLFVRH